MFYKESLHVCTGVIGVGGARAMEYFKIIFFVMGVPGEG